MLISPDIDPAEVLRIAQELDPILIERAVLRHLNDLQAQLIEDLQNDRTDASASNVVD